MRKILILTVVTTLFGCVTQASLIAQDGPRYKLDVNPLAKTLHTVIDGKEYNGSFVKNESIGIGFGQSFGARPSFGTNTMVMAGSNGQAVMTSTAGGYIECDFNASGVTVVGGCQSSEGRQFILTTN